MGGHYWIYIEMVHAYASDNCHRLCLPFLCYFLSYSPLTVFLIVFFIHQQ